MSGTEVRLIQRGEEHPYVIQVLTPGWYGCVHAFDGTLNPTMPADLRSISECLKESGVKYCSPFRPYEVGVMIFNADSTTEFVLRDIRDFQAAIKALVRAGWLSPDGPPLQTIL